MIFIWNIFLSQSTFNTRNHLFLSTRKVVKSFYLLNCTSACNFNSFETTKTLFFPYVRYFCREIFFHKLRFISSYTFFFFFNKILRYIFNISITFCTTVCQIFERNIWNISQIHFNILIISISEPMVKYLN